MRKNTVLCKYPAALPAAVFLLLQEQPVVHERYLRQLTGLMRLLTTRVTREISALTKRGLPQKQGSALLVADLHELERLFWRIFLER